jgi:hypothetical protein
MNKEQLEAKAEKAIPERAGMSANELYEARYWWSEGCNEALKGIDLDQVVYVPTSVEDELPQENGFYLCTENDTNKWMGFVWFSDSRFSEVVNFTATHWLKKTTIRQLTSK